VLANRSPRDQYVSAAITAIEMLKTGCTSAYDLFMALPSPTSAGVEAVVQAYVDVGMRAVLAPAVSDIVFHRTVPRLLDLLSPDLRRTVESFRATPADELLAMTEGAIRRWDGCASGRIRTAVSPTIPAQCTDGFLEGCARLMRQYGVGLHTHLAETKVQAVYGLQRWGTSTLTRLDEFGMVDGHFTGAHSVWLTDEDIRLLAERGGMVAHNPASNLRLGSGIAPIREMLDSGVTVGLGTDGSMSADNQCMFESMRFAGLVSRVRFPYEQQRWLSAEDVWRLATSGSARVLGAPSETGALVPGSKADLVLLREDSPFLRPLNRPVSSLAFAETGASVDTVLIDGKIVLRHGEVTGVNERALYAEAQDAAERVLSANQREWALAAEIEPYLREACSSAAATPFPVNRFAAPVG
jgi:5-methylthioadenosine/S-adenosylhomocysteine deaminase